MSNAFAPYSQLDLAPPSADRFVSGSPPSTTARQFSACPSDSASRRTPCPPEDYKRSGFRFPLAVSGFRLRARVGCSIPSPLFRPTRSYPRFWISRSSSERERDFNPPEQYAAQRTIGFVNTPGSVRHPQFAPTTPIEFRRITLNPA